MTGRTGREVHEKIFIYGKKTVAENIDFDAQYSIMKKYSLYKSALTRGYVPRGEVYAADYSGRYGTGKMIFENYNTNYSIVNYYIV